jgi:hypothetical protein
MLTKENFEHIVMERFTAASLDDREVELRPGEAKEQALFESCEGDSISKSSVSLNINANHARINYLGGASEAVTWENRQEYARLVTLHRLNESRQQAQWVRAGLGQVREGSAYWLRS